MYVSTYPVAAVRAISGVSIEHFEDLEQQQQQHNKIRIGRKGNN